MGPLTWEGLYALAASGALWPIDLVWHPALPLWLQAGQIPGLFPFTPPPTAKKRTRKAPAAQPQVTDPASQPQWQAPAYLPPWTGPSPRRRSWLLPFLLPLVVLIVLGGGVAAYFAFWHDSDGGGSRSA